MARKSLRDILHGSERDAIASAWKSTEAALPMSKHDLGKLGVTNFEQLDQPLPQGIRVKAKLALRRDDDGTEYNRIRAFEVLGIDEPERDAFAPKDEPTDGATENVESDTSFEYGHNRQDADDPAESDNTGDESQDDDPAVDGCSPATCELGAGI